MRASVYICFPEYYRITPGRIDVFEASPFSSKLKLKDTRALHGAKIACHYEKMRLSIIDTNCPDRPLVVNLDRVRCPAILVKGIFRGAMCRTETPRLPNDALLG